MNATKNHIVNDIVTHLCLILDREVKGGCGAFQFPYTVNCVGDLDEIHVDVLIGLRASRLSVVSRPGELLAGKDFSSFLVFASIQGPIHEGDFALAFLPLNGLLLITVAAVEV
jgi:hypothetical protein